MRLRSFSLSNVSAGTPNLITRPQHSWTLLSGQQTHPHINPHKHKHEYSRSHKPLYSNSFSRSNGQFRRSDFGDQPFSNIYDAAEPTAGPLGEASNLGALQITPRILKQTLDEYVVDQETAKKVLSTAVFNHYLRIQELRRQEDEADEALRRKERNEMLHKHPVQGTSYRSIRDSHQYNVFHDSDPQLDDLAGQFHPQFSSQQQQPYAAPLSHPKFQNPFIKAPTDTLNIEKSNVLVLGPSGVGKTLMIKTLASLLDIPFIISDCTPLTSAGYIGDDAEVVVQRLLAAANYDIARAETGIICLDEFDKIAISKSSHGKDVGGEGVQQALLKIIEGSSVTVQAKNEKVSAATERERNNSSAPSQTVSSSGKNELYTIRTDNIMFICAGAFNGIHKHIMDRMAKGSIGFNAPIRASNSTSSLHDTTIEMTPSNIKLYKEYLPHSFFSPNRISSPYSYLANPLHPSASATSTSIPSTQQPKKLNILDLVTAADLHRFGLIPELIGRVPIHTAVAPLTTSALARVLTEPRNALLKQYTAQFWLCHITLHFTPGAIREVARLVASEGSMTGARGLRSVMERVLRESMFEAPGSGVRYVLLTREVVKNGLSPIHLERGQNQLFERLKSEAEEQENDTRYESEGLSNNLEYKQDDARASAAVS